MHSKSCYKNKPQKYNSHPRAHLRNCQFASSIKPCLSVPMINYFNFLLLHFRHHSNIPSGLRGGVQPRKKKKKYSDSSRSIHHVYSERAYSGSRRSLLFSYTHTLTHWLIAGPSRPPPQTGAACFGNHPTTAIMTHLPIQTPLPKPARRPCGDVQNNHPNTSGSQSLPNTTHLPGFLNG